MPGSGRWKGLSTKSQHKGIFRTMTPPLHAFVKTNRTTCYKKYIHCMKIKKKCLPGCSGQDGMQTVTNEPNLQVNHITCTKGNGEGNGEELNVFNSHEVKNKKNCPRMCIYRHTHKRQGEVRSGRASWALERLWLLLSKTGTSGGF